MKPKKRDFDITKEGKEHSMADHPHRWFVFFPLEFKELQDVSSTTDNLQKLTHLMTFRFPVVPPSLH